MAVGNLLPKVYRPTVGASSEVRGRGLHQSDKCFNTPIENALCKCQFGVKWGKNRG